MPTFLDWAIIGPLIATALGSQALLVAIQRCLNAQKYKIEAQSMERQNEALDRQTAIIEASIRKEMTAENLQLRLDFSKVQRSSDLEIAQLRAEITLLKRRLDDCEGHRADAGKGRMGKDGRDGRDGRDARSTANVPGERVTAAHEADTIPTATEVEEEPTAAPLTLYQTLKFWGRRHDEPTQQAQSAEAEEEPP